jgi:protein-S-isoprenylcysteine O-methyltransferase Ste14
MHPSRRSLWIGGSIAAAGAILRVWAAGHIVKGRVLTQGGPYAFTRNPLYLGSFLMALGILLAGQGYWLLLPFFLLFGAIYYPVMKAEEVELLNGHGEVFRDYVRRVPIFLPRLAGITAGRSSFEWARVIRNREHRTLMGLAVVALVLVLKLLV